MKLDFQKHGVGKELIKRVQAEIGEECSLVLLSSPSAVEFYPQVGFEKAERAFVIKRQK